jgi:hypothetical protein
MRIGAIIAIVASALSLHAFGQQRLHATVKACGTYSAFGVNKKSSEYDKALDGATLKFKGKAGFGAGIGAQFDLSERLALFADARYLRWGGNVHIEDLADPKFYVDIEVTYHSLNVPLGVRYYFLNRHGYNLSLSAGGGLDRTFKMSYEPRNYYGTVDPIRRNVDISTWYLLFGVGMEFKVSTKLIGILGLEVNNDMLLNPHRMQDIGGYYALRMPLSYNLIALTAGIKI